MSRLVADILSAVVFFGIYGCGLLVIKEPIVIDIINGIHKKGKGKHYEEA